MPIFVAEPNRTLMAAKLSGYLIIDFDSTFLKVEGIEELAALALANRPDASGVLAEISSLTSKAMEGLIPFDQALEKRLSLIKANKAQVELLAQTLRNKVSDSFVRNRDFIEENADKILIISSGFRDLIEPVVAGFGIDKTHVYANTFSFDEEGNIIGFDRNNPLSQEMGKVKLLQRLNLQGEISVIGDGYTDYQIKEAGIAAKFFAFTENVSREKVLEVADHITPTFDEFLFVSNLPSALSYPKNRISVLLLENIHPRAVELFRKEGYQVETLKGALDEDELIEKIKGVSILGIRSKTRVTAKVLEAADKLLAVGAFCIGTNQIDLKACQLQGIACFNAPYSNTRSVVELAIGEIIMLIRNLAEKNSQMHSGIWNKSAGDSFEIRGKKLGIVGYGNIGTQLGVLAESLGMQVLYYDLIDKLALGNARKCGSLDELLAEADIVSLHLDGRKSNTHYFTEKQFSKMKPKSIFLNLSRGHVVDIEALVKAIKSGRVLGAGLDVFPYEPKTNDEPFLSELRGLPNVILTPHIGGSTEEAQRNIASFVPEKMMDYVNTGNTFMSVNFPNLQLPEQGSGHRLLHIHENTSGILAKINSVLANHGVNIEGQYLKTNENIGYVITDIDTEYNKDIIKEMKEIPHTIRFRVLY